jgi:hypothetical protein
MFRVIDPEDGDRPDILLMNPPGFEKIAVAADVRVSHPISTPANNITLSQAKRFGDGSIAARKGLMEKNRKF